jgi:hypothetical protein
MYFSSECLDKNKFDIVKSFSYTDASNSAVGWQDVCGYDLVGVSWSGVPEETAQALYLYENEVVHYGINCIYHPGLLFDLRVIING